MEITLYHYIHCPFCVRVRMALSYLKIKYTSIVLPYDDEATPIALTGVKMLPIAVIDGIAMNESLEIIKAIDSKNQLVNTPYPTLSISTLNELGDIVHNLCMPHWIWTYEFSDVSRAYFQKKKVKKRGPFKLLAMNNPLYAKQLEDYLSSQVEPKLIPFYESDKFSLNDLLLASHLWGMYIVPEFQFSPKIHQYLMTIKKITGFNYHETWI